MIIAALIVGVCFILLFFTTIYLGSKKGSDFGNGATLGVILSICIVVEAILLDSIFGTPKPTAMDVYQGKTTLEYTIRDSVKIDSVVIFKDSIYGK